MSMKSNENNNVENDNLICPITCQIFRDPVIAGDGHTYERSAIVRWITEHGTSPLTRQLLNINELQANDYLRNLATQRRTSTNSSIYKINHDHTFIQRENSTMSYHDNTYINQSIPREYHPTNNNNIVLQHNTRTDYTCAKRLCVVNLIVIILTFALTLPGLLSKPRNRYYYEFKEIESLLENTSTYSSWTISTNSPRIISTYLSTLTTDSPQYCRDSSCRFYNYYYYQAIEVNVDIASTCILTSSSSIDTYGYIYNNSFDPEQSNLNLLSSSDADGSSNKQFQFEVYLLPEITYILVVTTYSPETTGLIWITCSSQALVNLTNTDERKTSQFLPNIGSSDTWAQEETIILGKKTSYSIFNQLQSPRGLYIDNNLDIYISDTINCNIIKRAYYATRDKVVAGGNGCGNRSNQLYIPRDIFLDKEMNNIIICDSGNNRVVQWPLGGTSGITIISNITCQGLTMDEKSFLYVSDSEKHEVRRYRLENSKGTLVAGGHGEGNQLNQLNWPSCLFIDQNQSIYVSDSLNDRVMQWKKGAKEGTVVAGGTSGKNLTQLSLPRGIVVDRLGTVYIADFGNHRIVRWFKQATRGNVIINGDIHRFSPDDLSFDRYGNLYVVDVANDQVKRFDIQRTS